MVAVEAVISSVKSIQQALLVITGLQLTAYKWPESSSVHNGSSFDFIIVGAGTGGCILANRLTEIANFNVLLIEAGGDPPLESVLPGIFPTEVQSVNDYNFTSTDDGYTSQYLKNQVAHLTSGRMLGGTSGLNHMLYTRGNKHDYAKWVNATGDESWSYDNLLKYFIKSEKVEDETILNDESVKYHGTNGLLGLTRQPSPLNKPVLDAFNELGYKPVVNTNSPNFTLGISEPMLDLADGERRSAAEYLKPLANRTNFYLLKNTQVTKVLFDDNKKAIGVEAVDLRGNNVTHMAKRDVILSAGALSTPQLLMLSGVGPADHLESFDIPVISDLPVGKNLKDHIPAVVIHKLQKGDTVTAPVDPHKFPGPITTGYSALDLNQNYADYQTLNLIIPPNDPAFLQFCSIVFFYSNEICEAWFVSAAGHYTLFTAHNMMQPLSAGEVLLRSTNPFDHPIVHHGIYSNETDLSNMALYLQDFARIANTTTFKELGAAFVDAPVKECADIERNTYEFWKCYALSLSGTMWHYSATCSVGPVLDNKLHVKGVEGLRVADASAMPALISGNINPAVVVIAERLADIIKQE